MHTLQIIVIIIEYKSVLMVFDGWQSMTMHREGCS